MRMIRTNGHEWFAVGVLTVGLLVTSVEVAGAAPDPRAACEAAKIDAADVRSTCLARAGAIARRGRPQEAAGCEARFDQAIAEIDAWTAKYGGACRYVDNGDGTVNDLDTLLQWEKKTTDGSVHDVSNLYSWATSCPDNAPCLPTGTAFTDFLGTLDDCASTPSGGPPISVPGPTVGGFAGHCDWRLPSVSELQSILILPAACTQSPCIDAVFGPTSSSQTSLGYLTSTSSNLAFRYWYVDFALASPTIVATIYKDGMPGGPVRAVRGGR